MSRMRKSSSWTSFVPENLLSQCRNPFIEHKSSTEMLLRKSKSFDDLKLITQNNEKPKNIEIAFKSSLFNTSI